MAEFKRFSIGTFDVEIEVSIFDHKHRGYEESIRVGLSKNRYHIVEHKMGIYAAIPEVRQCLEGLFQDPYPLALGKYGEGFDLKAAIRLITDDMCNESAKWILDALVDVDPDYRKYIDKCINLNLKHKLIAK